MAWAINGRSQPMAPEFLVVPLEKIAKLSEIPDKSLKSSVLR
jgi:hypothetical protein